MQLPKPTTNPLSATSNMLNENEYHKKMKSDGINVLTCEDPSLLLIKIQSGEISRFDCWNILRLIHEGEFSCNLPQYGTITVFALCKDFEEFGRLYDQGIQMLRENNVISPEQEEIVAKKTILEIKLLKKKKKKKKKNIDTPESLIPKFKPNNNRLN